jgi:hypothetical protein
MTILGKTSMSQMADDQLQRLIEQNYIITQVKRASILRS